MKLQTLAPPEGGSLSVVYSCPECGYEMAMLTNPFETQLVQSLGVRIGPETNAGASSVAEAPAEASVASASVGGHRRSLRRPWPGRRRGVLGARAPCREVYYECHIILPLEYNPEYA